MTQPRSLRYSDAELEEALASVSELFVEQLGLDDANEAPRDLDQPVGDYCDSKGDCDGMDLASIIRALEDLFQTKVEPEVGCPWNGAVGIEFAKDTLGIPSRKLQGTPNLAGLAEWILDHRPVISTEPLAIAGTTCEKAGLFLGLRDLANWVDKDTNRIAPSTALRDIFVDRESLGRFWFHVQRIGGPPLPKLHDRSAFGCMGIILVTAIVGFCAVIEEYLLALLIALSGLSPVRGLFQIDDALYYFKPMPCGLETFGDLARFIQQKQ